MPTSLLCQSSRDKLRLVAYQWWTESVGVVIRYTCIAVESPVQNYHDYIIMPKTDFGKLPRTPGLPCDGTLFYAQNLECDYGRNVSDIVIPKMNKLYDSIQRLYEKSARTKTTKQPSAKSKEKDPMDFFKAPEHDPPEDSPFKFL